MPGELVGEMVIFHPDAKRSATIVSHAPGLIATMLVSEFEALVEELPEVGSKWLLRPEDRAAVAALALAEDPA